MKDHITVQDIKEKIKMSEDAIHNMENFRHVSGIEEAIQTHKKIIQDYEEILAEYVEWIPDIDIIISQITDDIPFGRSFSCQSTVGFTPHY